MTSREYAEQRPYWQTTVHPAKSQGEIVQLLEEFGAGNTFVAQGNSEGRLAWVVRFEWRAHVYRFVFTPRDCQYPDKTSSFSGKRRGHVDQAKYQMGRTAVHFVKAMLTAAEENPAALFGFVEIPEAGHLSGGLPLIASEVDISVLTDGSLPPLLPTGSLQV